MMMLAESAGLSMERMEYDSTESQSLGSELYARDVPLGGASLRDLRSYFPRARVWEFRSAASCLNREGRGDQAVFLLKDKG